MKRAFTNARLVCPTRGVLAGTLITEGDRIVSVAQTGLPSDAEVVECKGLTLAPAIVDLGVFAIDLPAFHAGGIARVGLMPDQSPVLDDPGIVQRARSEEHTSALQSIMRISFAVCCLKKQTKVYTT